MGGLAFRLWPRASIAPLLTVTMALAIAGYMFMRSRKSEDEEAEHA